MPARSNAYFIASLLVMYVHMKSQATHKLGLSDEDCLVIQLGPHIFHDCTAYRMAALITTRMWIAE